MTGKRSAGILPYRVGPDGGLRVLVVHPGGPLWKNKDEHAWSIAKGEYEPDEEAERAAEREFAEELGVEVPEGPRIALGTIRQSSGKQVSAWAVRADDLSPEGLVSNTFEMEWPPRSGERRSFPEVDEARWMSLPEARQRLIVAQGEFLDRLAAALADDPPSEAP
jgi:predicted NUDIX family NTP pyrophosphohydrolase